MTICVLTGFVVLLASNKAWMAFIAMAITGLIAARFKNYGKEIINRHGGVDSARVLGRTCHRSENRLSDPRDTEYTVLVHYRNGDKVKYVLNGNQDLFKELRPYLGKV